MALQNHSHLESHPANEKQPPPARKPRRRKRRAKVDGDRSKKHGNPAKARYKARRRAERFAAWILAGAPRNKTIAPAPVTHDSRAVPMLIIGGLGHLGQTALQPAIRALGFHNVDCLDLLRGYE